MKPHSKNKLQLLLISACLLYLLAGNILYAQNDFRFENFTSENGLSENVVYSIFQDSKGYLWIGTDNGLNRYDGYGFKKFRYDPSDNNSLPGNRINSICEDSLGNIWFATNGGLCRYIYNKGKFMRVSLQNSFSNFQQVISINKNEIMVRFANSISLFDINTFKRTDIGCRSNNVLKLDLPLLYPLHRDKNGNIYMVQNTGTGQLWRYDTLSRSFIEFLSFQTDKKNLKEIKYFFLDDHDNCWIEAADNKSIYILSGKISDKKTLDLSVAKEISASVQDIYEDIDGNIWFCTMKGLLFYNYTSKKFSYYGHDSFLNSISSDIVNTIYQDRTGNIWLGTFTGLNKLNPFERKFIHLTADPGSTPALFNNFILGIYPDNNKVSIQYLYGTPYFSRLDLTDNSIKHYSINNCNFFDYIKNCALKNPADFNDTTFDKLFSRLYKMGRDTITPSSLIVDSRQNLWYKTGSGFILINTMQKWDFGFSILDMQIYNNEIWLATPENGLICFNIPTQKVTKFLFDPSDSNSINSNDVTCFLIEKNGNMSVGTKGGGINYFNLNKKIFLHYTEENGLCNNSIYNMVKDEKDRLWLGTSNGLSCFDPISCKFRNYFRSDGLVNSEYNRYSACKLKDGSLLMGGMNGIDYFHPDSLIENNKKPQIQITDFKVFNKSIFPAGNFSLSHDENSITIEFAAMDFRNPGGNKFSYKLENADRDWVTMENRNFATYSALSPGHYHFLVKGANSDGVWNDQPAVIEFIIRTPWWRTWWFYTCCAFFITSLLLSFYRYRINQLKKLMAIRTRISQDLHDDIGASLSSIHIYSSVAEKTMGEDAEKSKTMLRQINHNTRKVMEDMSDIVWAMNTNQSEETSFSSRIKNYGYDLLSQKNIECNYQIDEQAEKKLQKPEARKNILLIVKEAMNNIAKYSGASHAAVHIATDEKNILIKITDNGKGFENNNIPKGNGLNNMKQRSAILEGTFIYSSSPGKGTTIQCSIPITNISDR
jgi:ligand-binding sensor domain-containing protein